MTEDSPPEAGTTTNSASAEEKFLSIATTGIGMLISTVPFWTIAFFGPKSKLHAMAILLVACIGSVVGSALGWRMRAITRSRDEALLDRVRQIGLHIGVRVDRAFIDHGERGRTRAFCRAERNGSEVLVSRRLMQIATDDEMQFLLTSALACARDTARTLMSGLFLCLFAWIVSVEVAVIIWPGVARLLNTSLLWWLVTLVCGTRYLYLRHCEAVFAADSAALVLTGSFNAAESILSKMSAASAENPGSVELMEPKIDARIARVRALR